MAGKGIKGVTDMLNRYWQDEQGLATVEYALLLALIVAVALTAWRETSSEPALADSWTEV